MRRFPSEPLNLVDHLHDGVLFLRAFPERSLNYFTALGALIPLPVVTSEYASVPSLVLPVPVISETEEAREARLLAAPLNRYEQAHRGQIMLRRGFLPDGTPIRADADYSILHHDTGYGGPRGDVA